MQIKRQSVELLINNILKLNLKNLNKGILGIKFYKDDLDSNTDEK